jgi:CheY-like chemotaxis protein
MVLQRSNPDYSLNSLPACSVLVVDDDEDSLILMAYVLENLACEACFVSDGYGALIAAKRYQPALILTDIHLPELDGFKLIQQLRLDRTTQNIPIVAVTALADSEARQQILSAGFDDYITKPFLLTALEDIIIRFVNVSCPLQTA